MLHDRANRVKRIKEIIVPYSKRINSHAVQLIETPYEKKNSLSPLNIFEMLMLSQICYLKGEIELYTNIVKNIGCISSLKVYEHLEAYILNY
jgi:hypothetical protein